MNKGLKSQFLIESPLDSLSAQWVASHLPSRQIQSIFQRAEDVFGIPEVAGKWLQEPNLATDGQPPITLLGSEGGYARVKTLLDRIDYGVLA